MLAWLDLETTGLDERIGSILEIAIVVTSNELVALSAFTSVVRPVTDLSEMGEYVAAMHTNNGLLEQVKLSDPPRRYEVEMAALAFVERNLPKGIPLAGSTVSFDRAWLRGHMPTLAEHFGYRNVDVSSLKELAKRWAPDVYHGRPKGAPAHRALPDILHSIEELRHYRREMLHSSKPDAAP